MIEPRNADDALARELRGLVRTDTTSPAGGAVAAVRTSRRRLLARAAGSTVLVAALVVGVPLGLSLGGTSAAPLLVATQEPSTPATTPSTPATPSAGPSAGPSVAPPAAAAPPAVVVAEPSQEPSGEPSQEPSQPPAPPVREVLQVAAAVSGPSSAGDLVGLVLVDADELADVDAGAPASWALGGCEASGAPGDDARTGWAAQETYGGDSGRLLSVAGYPDEATAARAVAALAALAARCLDGPVAGREESGAARVWRERSLSDAGLTGTSRWYEEPTPDELAALADPLTPAFAPPVLRGGMFVAVVRDGRSVALAVVREDYGGGGAIAVADGDTRPGAGLYPGDAGQTAMQYVDGVVEQARAEAAALAGAASAHLAR